MNPIQKAKQNLQNKNITFSAINGENEYLSEKRGISPILFKYDVDSSFFYGASVADRVIGKAAAMLLVKYGVKEIYAEVISSHAVSFLNQTNVEFTYSKVVEYIVNRDKTDMCPMEKTVLNISDLDVAEKMLREKIENIRKR